MSRIPQIIGFTMNSTVKCNARWKKRTTKLSSIRYLIKNFENSLDFNFMLTREKLPNELKFIHGSRQMQQVKSFPRIVFGMIPWENIWPCSINEFLSLLYISFSWMVFNVPGKSKKKKNKWWYNKLCAYFDQSKKRMQKHWNW